MSSDTVTRLHTPGEVIRRMIGERQPCSELVSCPFRRWGERVLVRRPFRTSTVLRCWNLRPGRLLMPTRDMVPYGEIRPPPCPPARRMIRDDRFGSFDR